MFSSKASLPPALRAGDTIAFVSPSSRLNTLFSVRIKKATRFFERQGFFIKVIFTETLPRDHLHAIRQRCEELHEAFRDPSVKAIICTIGGFSANELLPHLDYEMIRKNPKIFCGYSDITLLHSALFMQAGLRTFYGPAVIPEFGEEPDALEFTASHFRRILMQADVEQEVPRSPVHTMEFKNWLVKDVNQRPRELEPSPAWQWLRGGKANGRLHGGCLPSIVQLCGTKYLPDFQGCILLLELPEGETPGLPFSLVAAQTAMADLRNSGVLENVAGVVVGRPYMYVDEMRAAFQKMIVDQCYGIDFPILANVDTGHSDPMLTLPLGAKVLLDSTEGRFTILEEIVAV